MEKYKRAVRESTSDEQWKNAADIPAYLRGGEVFRKDLLNRIPMNVVWRRIYKREKALPDKNLEVPINLMLGEQKLLCIVHRDYRKWIALRKLRALIKTWPERQKLERIYRETVQSVDRVYEFPEPTSIWKNVHEVMLYRARTTKSITTRPNRAKLGSWQYVDVSYTNIIDPLWLETNLGSVPALYYKGLLAIPEVKTFLQSLLKIQDGRDPTLEPNIDPDKALDRLLVERTKLEKELNLEEEGSYFPNPSDAQFDQMDPVAYLGGLSPGNEQVQEAPKRSRGPPIRVGREPDPFEKALAKQAHLARLDKLRQLRRDIVTGDQPKKPKKGLAYGERAALGERVAHGKVVRGPLDSDVPIVSGRVDFRF